MAIKFHIFMRWYFSANSKSNEREEKYHELKKWNYGATAADLA